MPVQVRVLAVAVAAAMLTTARPSAQTMRAGGDDIAMFLRSFVPRAHVQIGAELIDPRPIRNGTIKDLDIPLSPEQGVATIVGTDARYEWSRDGDIIRIRPKSGLRVAGPLDTVVKPFAVVAEPFGAVLDRILWSVAPPGGGGGGAYFGREAPQTAPITMAVTKEEPVRQALDELCRIAGGVSWVGRAASAAGGLNVEIIGGTLTLERAAGGPVRTVPFPSGPVDRPVPPTVDRSDLLKKPSPLDVTVDRFDADSEPLAMVFERVLWRMGIEPGGGRPPRADSPWLHPVSLHVTHPVTVRELLNALTAAAPGTSWNFSPRLPSGDTSIELRSGVDWPLGRLAYLPMEMLELPVLKPTRPPGVTLPPGYDRPIPQTRVYLGGDDGSLMHLAGFARRAIGIELLPEPAANAATRRSAPQDLVLGPGPFDDALFVLLEHMPRYTMILDGDVPNVVPVEVAKHSNHFLDVPLDHFEVKDVSILEAFYALRHALNPAFPEYKPGPSSYIGGFRTPAQMQAAQEMFDRHVSLAIDRATPRHILNRLVAVHGGIFWSAEYRGWLGTASASPGDADCTFSIRTFDDLGMSISLTPRR